ncbi:MAG: hypothetical protein J6A74_01400 [Oscillospiraceae bacterium]|nr:hypothetical protein [Oscillospiraceae bacterium]
MKRAIAFVLTAIIVIGILTACGVKSDRELIQDRVDVFLSAYNAGDMEETLECFDAKTRNTYKSAMNVGNALIGMTGLNIGLGDIFGLGVGLLSDEEMLRLEEMEIEILSDTEAVVSAKLYFESYEESSVKDICLTLVKENGDWYFES